MDCVGLFLINTGKIRTYLLSDDGKEVTLYRLGRGDTCILSASCALATITFDVYIGSRGKNTGSAYQFIFLLFFDGTKYLCRMLFL